LRERYSALLLGIGRASPLQVAERSPSAPTPTCLSRHTGAGSGLCRFFILPEAGIELDSFTAGAIALSNIAACFHLGNRCIRDQGRAPGQLEAAASSRAQPLPATAAGRHAASHPHDRPVPGRAIVLLVKDSSVVSAIGLLDLTRSGWVIVQSPFPMGCWCLPWWAWVF
jgi:ABC-type arginine transport system permease subunit